MATDTVKSLEPPAATRSSLWSSRRIILVVEDEQLVVLDVQRRLAPLGYVVVSAPSGEEAIDHVRRSRPDLILMDIKLTGMDGIDAAHCIRDFQDIPIIYLTAYADQTTLERARFTEAYGYILKPFDTRELRAAIEMALQRHSSHRRE